MATVTMSDAEIRRKIIEFNIENVPLTETTRHILIQLIKKRSEEAKTPGRASLPNASRSRKTFSHFSSGEDESEDDLKKSEKKQMPPPSHRGTRRQTVGGSSEKTVSITSKSRRSEVVRNEPTISPSLELESKISSGRSSVLSEPSKPSARNSSPLISSPRSNVTLRRRVSRNTDEYDDGSDSDIPVAKVLSGLRETREKKTAPENLDDIQNKMSTSKFLSRLSSFKSSSEQNGSDSNNDSVDSLMSYRKSPKLPLTDTKKRLEAGDSSPFQSEYLRKISGLSPVESRQFGSWSPRTSELFKLRERGSGGNAMPSSSSSLRSQPISSQNGHFPRASSSRDLSGQFKTHEEEPSVWKDSNMKSMIVVAVAIVFFLVLAAFYVYVSSNEIDNYSADSKRNSFPMCGKAGDNALDAIDAAQRPCVPAERMSRATALIRYVHPELKRRAIRATCGPPEQDGTYIGHVMSDEMIVNFLANKHKMTEWTVGQSLRDLKVLSLANPHWGMEVVGADGDNHRLADLGALAASNVTLPTWCYVRQKVAAAASTLIAVLAGLVALFAGHRCVRWYLAKRQRDKQEVFVLLQRILDVLQSHEYLAINHVRDQLIPPQDRQRMSGMWDKVVRFVEHHESRIRCEVQYVSGEEYPVWRWLPPPTLNASATSSVGSSSPASPAASPLPNSISLSGSDSHPNRTKVWQGQAFVTEPGAQNGAPRSPTPCLKVRHMFDDSEFGDDWPRKVQDAILEKCGGGVKVLHMVVDETSNEGLVYIKLATKEDAGTAYRALHGWWFDSKLVTVKYIRLERYHERFPQSVNATTPLAPSNDKKLSLSNIGSLSTLDGN